MLPSVSFFKVNLWVAILLALTVFSGVCVDESMGFAFTAPNTNAASTITSATTRKQPLQFQCQFRSTTSCCGKAAFASSSSSSSSSRLASTVIDAPTKEDTDTDTTVEIIKENVTEDEKKNGKNGWEIQLFNDPFNHRTFVAKCLCTICGKTDTQSYQIMMQAHKNGMGVVGRYHYEIAELYYGSLKEEGLTVDMVEVDDE